MLVTTKIIIKFTYRRIMSFQFPDEISPNITLYYKNETKHSSLFSKILTFFAYIGVAAISCFFIYDFLSKKLPNAFYFNKFINDTGSFYFNTSGLFHVVSPWGQYDKRAFTVLGLRNIGVGTFVVNPNPENYDHWIYEQCDQSEFPKSVKEYLGEGIEKFKYSLCISKFYNKTTKKIINKEDSEYYPPSLEHGSGNPNLIYYGIIIQRCVNSTVNNNSCYSDEVIKEKIQSMLGYSLYFVDNSVNVENYKHPISQNFPEVSAFFSPNTYSVNNLNFFPLTIRTHKGYLFDYIKDTLSYKYNLNEKLTYDSKDSGIFGSVYFWMPNRLEVYERSYKKIQDLAASLGGVSKLILTVAQMINYFYHYYIIINDFNIEVHRINKKVCRTTTVVNSTNIHSTNVNSISREKRHLDSKNTNDIISYSRNTKGQDEMKSNSIILTNNSPVALIKKRFQHYSFNTVLKFLFSFHRNENLNNLLKLRAKILGEEHIVKNYFKVKIFKRLLINKNTIIGGQQIMEMKGHKKVKIYKESSLL